MKKNISKIQWFGSDLENGKAKAPVISPDAMSHLEGLNEGEFYICNADEDPAIFIRTNKNNVVAFKLAADVDMEALKKVFLRKDQDDTTPYKLTIRGGLDTGWDESQAEPTGSISKDGILNYAAAILKYYLSSPKFIPGFTGEGFKIYKDEYGNWRIECDILDVRKVMNVFELIIQKIRSVNGALVISQANGKVSAVTESPDLQSWILEFEDKDETFQAHDLVRCQVFDRITIQSPAFDFTKFTAYNYDGTAIDDSVKITSTSIEFNMNNSKNSGFQLYMYPADHIGETPISTKECRLEISGPYDGAMAVWSGITKDGTGSDSVGGLLKNGENIIRAINASEEIYNLAIMIVLDSGHGNGKVTVTQKIEDTSSKKGKYYWCEVASVNGNLVTIPKSEFEGVEPVVGDEVVQMGNTENPLRQSLIYMSAAEGGKPKIELVGGVKTKSLTGTSRSVFGNLDHITDPSFPDDMQPHGDGVYTDNGFFKGAFVFFNGKNAQTEIEKAQTDASNAQAEANAAKDRLNKWASDGFISPSEKQQLLLEKKVIAAEKSEINSDANRYNVDTTSYNSAYDAYLSQINQHTAAEPENIPVGANLLPCQTDYYNNRTQILNAIAVAVKAKTDYLETEMSAIPGKITLAIRSSKTSNVNLLKGANTELKDQGYFIGFYRYDDGVSLKEGKTYTLTLCYTLSSSATSIVPAVSSGGTGELTPFTTKGPKVVESKSVTIISFEQGYMFQFIQLPDGADGSKVHWAVLTEGDVGVSNWIPAASESKLNIGGENLLLESGRRFEGYYDEDSIRLYTPWGDLRGKTLTLSFDYNYRNLILASPNTRVGMEKRIRKEGTTEDYYVGGWMWFDSTSPKSGKGRFTHTFKIPDDIENTLDDDIGIYIQLGRSSICEISYFQIEIGDTATGWKPAPKDLVEESKRYTDTAIEITEGKIDLSVKTQIDKLNIGSSNLLNGSKEYWFNQSDFLSNVELAYNPASNAWMNIKGKGGFNCYKQWMPLAEKQTIIPGKSYTLGIDVDVSGNYYHTVSIFFNVRYYNGSTSVYIADTRLELPNEPGWKRRYVTITLPSVMPSGVTVNDLFWLCGFTGENKTTNIGLSVSYKNINLVEGSVGSSWAPSSGDIFGASVEYTTSQIELLEKQIKLKVDSTVVDALGNTIREQGSQILLNTQKIEQTVTKTEYSGGLSRAEAIARYISTGKMLSEHSDVAFKTGLNGLARYNNAGNESVTLHRASVPALPNDSGYMAVITCKGAGSPGAGGFYFGNQTRANAVFLYKITAMIPGGKTIQFATNPSGDGAVTEWLTDRDGTGTWKDYYALRKCGASGTFSSTGFFYIEQQGTFEWYLAYATCYDVYGDNSQITKTVYQTKITQLEESISLKATKTEVTNSINGLSGRLEAAEIKLQPNNISLVVREEGIGYGGTNYFGWGGNLVRDLLGGGIIFAEQKVTYGFTMGLNSTSDTILLRYSGLGFSFKGPGKYTLSFRAQAIGGHSYNFNLCDAEDFIISPGTSWAYYKKTFNVTKYTELAGYNGFLDVEKTVSGAITGILNVAEIMIEYGSEATQWRPAPFDTTPAQGLRACGIDITNNEIILTANRTQFKNMQGSLIAMFDSNGINADLINAKKLNTAASGKRIVVDPEAQEVQLYNENGNKVASIGFKQDDKISIPYIQMKDYSYTGAITRAFDIYGGTIYSNETRYGANYGFTLSTTTGLQFTKNGAVTKSYPAQ